MIRYYKLFDLLNRKDMKKSDLRKIISGPTITKLAKGETVRTDVIDKICEFLSCQPGDIMEYIIICEDTNNNTEVEIANHIDISGLPDELKPDPDDINIYPSDKDSPYEKGYKRRI